MCVTMRCSVAAIVYSLSNKSSYRRGFSPMRLLDFGIGDAGEIALRVEEAALVLSVQIGDIGRTCEVGDEHPVAGNVEGDANSFHQVPDQDLGHRFFVDRHAIDGVAARRITAVGLIEDAVR
jgi:hypothetical protein